MAREQAGFSLEQMIQLLDGGLSVRNASRPDGVVRSSAANKCFLNSPLIG